ncbi:MAG: glutamate formimidoyltransferase [Bacteroidales bacterium]|nr:glutamate formimidoyltransferase [Bacteroidales bacterium]
MRLIECVPNFSEGRDQNVIDSIVAAISSVDAVKVLDVDTVRDAGRTVVTFIGEPSAVCEAAFAAVRTSAELIDMRMHHGTHPRLGATDVLPLIPLSGTTIEECVTLARGLAQRIWEELGIPCYCYEAAAFVPDRANLAVCRSGEYEALPAKIADPSRRPDFGPSVPGAAALTWESLPERIARSGACNVGARKFLIAVNFNLDTTSVPAATAIAREVRESGYHGVPGTLKGCKALGWYIEEYGLAQVTMNVTDIDATPLHVAYEEVCRVAALHGLHVTGTEIIGMLPARALLEAGAHFASASSSSAVASPADPRSAEARALMELAVREMHLDWHTQFELDKRVIELAAGDIL